jgi:hypothetical protein
LSCHTRRFFEAAAMEDVRIDDWTPNIAPFWPAVIHTAARPRNAARLLRTGVDGVRSALAMFLMVVGYKVRGGVESTIVLGARAAASPDNNPQTNEIDRARVDERGRPNSGLGAGWMSRLRRRGRRARAAPARS